MAELHRKQYPYADEFVYLVSGGAHLGAKVNPNKLTSAVIVGRSPQEVSDRWMFMANGAAGWEVQSCMSLSQMRPLYEAMEAAVKNPSACPVIPKSGLFSFGREPWIVALKGSTESGTLSQTVFAHDAEDIASWANAKSMTVATALPRSFLKSAIQKMEEVQLGRSASENYVRGDADFVDMHDRVESAMKSSSEEEMARLLALARYINASKD